MATSFSKTAYAGTSYSSADMLVSITVKDTESHKNTTCVLGELQTLSYSTHMERGSVRKLGNINVSDYTNGPRTIAGSLVFAVFNRHMIQPILDQMGVKEKVLPDELPPFDVTITFANEYGHSSVLRIYGVRLVNEGEVLSINDIYIENTYQYVAQNIEMLQKTSLTPFSEEEVKDPIIDKENNNKPKEDNEVLLPNIDNILDLEYEAPEEEANKDQIVVPDITSQLVIDFIDAKGYVKFNVDKTQPNLVLTLMKNTSLEKKYNIPEVGWPFSLKLIGGEYHASLERSTDNKFFNEVTFSVPVSKPSAPIITNVTHNAISGEVKESNIISIRYTDEEFKTHIVKLNKDNKTFIITDLTPLTEYFIEANDSNGQISSSVRVVTYSDLKNIYENFKFFIDMNLVKNKDEIIDFISKAEGVNKTFLESIYDTYMNEIGHQNRIKSNKTYLKQAMHLAAYYDLCLSQKNLRFDFKNKWLCDIRPAPSQSTQFKVYSKNGISQNSQKASGLLRFQHFCDKVLEKILTYRSDQIYHMTLQQDYLAKQKLLNSMKESYNARYGLLPIQTNYDFYDHYLVSDGAYIDILDNQYLEAHYRSSEAYYVFKEDLCVDIVFKVKADHKIDYRSLDFYDARNNYIVYLEYDNKPISKSIRIINNQAEYAYGTLLSYALDRKMQDFIKEICMEQLNFLDMFCYGFYLLVNRKKINRDYLQLFDTLLYNFQKNVAIKYHLEDRYLIFDQAVDYLIFDNEGNLLEKAYNEKILIRFSGYLVWSTSKTQADYLNFENI